MNDAGTTTEQATVRLERLLPGPIERVWAYLNRSRQARDVVRGRSVRLAGGRESAPALRPLEIFRRRNADEYKSKKSDWSETVTRVEAPRLLSYTFGPAGPESEVTFELETRGKDVLLVITIAASWTARRWSASRAAGTHTWASSPTA